MNIVDSKFTLLSRRTLCRTVLPSALEQIKTKMKQVCDDARFLSLTLDVWTDRRMRAFLAVTVHTVNEVTGDLNNYLLSFRPLEGMPLLVCKFDAFFFLQGRIQVKIFAVNLKALSLPTTSMRNWFALLRTMLPTTSKHSVI
jgi:hypothetical protein